MSATALPVRNLLSRAAFRSFELLRTVRLTPYRRGAGPVFTLSLYDTLTMRDGRTDLAYRLTMRENGVTTVVFSDRYFSCSHCCAIDSDESLACLMGFLTLRAGDIDSDYFADYDAVRIAYRDSHAEALSYESMERFGEY